MKNIYFLILALTSFLVSAQITVSPNPFQVSGNLTLTVDINDMSTGSNTFNNPGGVYMHSGIGDDDDPFGFNVIGNWGEDDGVGEMTDMGGGIYQIQMTPSMQSYYGITAQQAADATKIGIVFRNESGTQTLRGTNGADFVLDIGEFYFEVNLTSPSSTTTVLNSGESLNIQANNTAGNASYTLRANGSILSTNSSTSNFSFNHTNITQNQSYELEVTLGGNTVTKRFNAVVSTTPVSEPVPTGMRDGINYDDSDTSVATLVLTAPGKDFVYVAGSFNNYAPDQNFSMRKDPSSDKFWLTLTGLTAGQIETYQYWVVDQTPATDSPQLVKTADPFSTLLLSDRDVLIPASTYPNLPAYPTGQEREVTVLETGQTPYNWQVPNFEKPKIEDLIIYEVLVRDFDANRNYQDLIDRMDYFTGLNINAIHLMPIMDFDADTSWGYDSNFHMAIDKSYGTQEKLKEFIDLCHQNGIAVILDVVLNHAFGRNPMVRMWMKDADGDGWGEPSSENPYFNEFSRHSFNVGSDFNHQSALTQEYSKRVIEHWIQEFNIDGFRWDLTKGFTQNCSGGDDGCTNAYQQDRVDVLRSYADHAWSIDNTHFVIFEHLGTDNEEQQWANYRVNEGKGIMMWGKMTNEYNQLTMGFPDNASINRMGHSSRGFQQPRLLGYPESHDEERLMYRNLQFGNNFNPAHNVRELNVALSRMSALGAASVLIPGPKMIWHFGDLGMENSIFTCRDGSLNFEGDPTPGDCKLDTKPQPQWTDNWLADANRKQIYDDWAIMHALKTTEDVFEGNFSISAWNNNNLFQRIYIWDDSIPQSELKNVVVLTNFAAGTVSIRADFPYTGTWYDLMDISGGTTIDVTDTEMTITIPPGQFRVFGNQDSTLSTQDVEAILKNNLIAYPNPVSSTFQLNKEAAQVQVFNMQGQMVKEFSGNIEKNTNFDVANLPTGVYMIRMFDSENQMYTSKLIKI